MTSPSTEPTVSTAQFELPAMAIGSIQKVLLGDRWCSVDHAHLTPIGIAPVVDAEQAVSAFGYGALTMNPVISVAEGARCNCYNFSNFAPHLQGTHIETRQHVLLNPTPVVDHFRGISFLARLITVTPSSTRGLNLSLIPGDRDTVVTCASVEDALSGDSCSAQVLIIRTPNFSGKQSFKYGGTNPPYPHHDLARYLVGRGVTHVVLDLPSADREEGELYFHRTFWQDPISANGERIVGLEQVPNAPRDGSAIVELAYIPDSVSDGWYIIYLAPIGLPGDSAPIWPILAPVLDFV